MFYTKIPRKSLALLLISLIFTLAAVGIMFIIYFFNANNSLFMKPLLKQIYTESYHHYQQQQQQQQQMKQHRAYAQNYNIKDTDGISYQPYGIGINTHMIKYLKKDTKHHQIKNIYQQGGSDEDGMHEIEVNDDNNNNGKNNNYYTNSDTIYIDDYDRNDKIDWNNNKLNNKYINNNNNNDNADNDLLGINNIDYFETIIMDHKKSSTHNNNNNDNNNNNSNNNNNHYNNIINKSEKIIATQASVNSDGGNDEDILIFTKSLNNRRNKLNKIKENSLRNKNIINKKDNIIHNNNSDDENRDNETIGSGSGDFIDDTELDEDIFIKTKPRLRPLRRNKLRSQKKNHRISGGIERRSDINISSNNESLPPIDAISNETALPSSSTLPSSSSTSSLLLSSALSSSSSLDITMPTVSSLSLLRHLTSSMQPIQQQSDNRKTRINKLDRKPSISSFSGKKWMPPSIVSSREVAAKMADDDTTNAHREYQNGAWLETRARRIMGNVKKSEEKSRQLLLCEEAGGGELCRMLFKGYLNE